MGNDLWGIEWSRDRLHHVTLKGQTRDPSTLIEAPNMRTDRLVVLPLTSQVDNRRPPGFPVKNY